MTNIAGHKLQTYFPQGGVVAGLTFGYEKMSTPG